MCLTFTHNTRTARPRQDQDRLCWSETGLVLRLMVTDDITVENPNEQKNKQTNKTLQPYNN